MTNNNSHVTNDEANEYLHRLGAELGADNKVRLNVSDIPTEETDSPVDLTGNSANTSPYLDESEYSVFDTTSDASSTEAPLTPIAWFRDPKIKLFVVLGGVTVIGSLVAFFSSIVENAGTPPRSNLEDAMTKRQQRLDEERQRQETTPEAMEIARLRAQDVVEQQVVEINEKRQREMQAASANTANADLSGNNSASQQVQPSTPPAVPKNDYSHLTGRNTSAPPRQYPPPSSASRSRSYQPTQSPAQNQPPPKLSVEDKLALIQGVTFSMGSNPYAQQYKSSWGNKSTPESRTPHARDVQPTNVSSSGYQMIRGTRARARLLQDFTLTPNRIQQIILEEDLPANDSSVPLPKGTTLLIQLGESRRDSGLPKLPVVAVQMEVDGVVQEFPLPENSIFLQGKEGEPLRFKQSQDGGLPVDPGTAVGVAAELLDLPRGVSRSAQNLTRSNRRLSNRSNYYYQIRKGDDYEVVVNETFILNLQQEENDGQYYQNDNGDYGN